MEMIKHRLSDFLSWYFLKSDNTPPSNFSVSDRKLSPPIRLFNSWLFKLQTQSHRRVCFRSSNSYLFLSFEPQGPLPSCLRTKRKDDGTKVVLWEQSKLCRLKELNYNIFWEFLITNWIKLLFKLKDLQVGFKRKMFLQATKMFYALCSNEQLESIRVVMDTLEDPLRSSNVNDHL